MIICICQAVTDRKIRSAIQSGAESFEDIQFQLGVASSCGQCAQAVCCLIKEEKTNLQAAATTPELQLNQTTRPIFYATNRSAAEYA